MKKPAAVKAPKPARPLIKYAGGKHALLAQLIALMPPRVLWQGNGYRSPFIGGAADFFGLAADVRPAVLSDNNQRLVDTYIAVRDCPEDVIAELRCLENRPEVFYAVRARFNAERFTADLAERAAWMIFLNKTNVNGLYRENKDGQFNVSYGKHPNPYVPDAANIMACSAALRKADLRCCDFAVSLAEARPGELVFLDPTYVPLPGKKSFTSYTATRFTSTAGATQEEMLGMGRSDQERLAAIMKDLDARGVYFMACNSDTEEARRVYAGWDIRTVTASRAMGALGTTRDDRAGGDDAARDDVTEIVIRNSSRWT